jgi:protein-S-isoprenylcysteine O-methyltransferase Ste14
MVATGLILATWCALRAARAIFLGNQIRIREEERLLRETFGDQFEKYAESVSSFRPGMPLTRGRRGNIG